MSRKFPGSAGPGGPPPSGAGPFTLESLITSLQNLTPDDELIVRVVQNLCDSGVLRRALDRGRVLH